MPAEEALDQLLGEPKTDPRMREPASTFVAYARRLAQSVTTLHSHPPRKYSAGDLSRLSELRARVERSSKDFAAAVCNSRAAVRCQTPLDKRGT